MKTGPTSPLAVALVALTATGALAALLAPRFFAVGKGGAVDAPAAVGVRDEQPRAPLAPIFTVPAFELTAAATGARFGSARLAGRPYVAMFFFSHCEGVCPGMTLKMAELQRAVPADVALVAFTVDPERDTPERLRATAESVGADPARWHFLTGTPAQMKDVAAKFLSAYEVPSEHTSRFFLVDPVGQVRGLYEQGDAEAMRQLRADAAALAAGKVP